MVRWQKITKYLIFSFSIINDQIFFKLIRNIKRSHYIRSRTIQRNLNPSDAFFLQLRSYVIKQIFAALTYEIKISDHNLQQVKHLSVALLLIRDALILGPVLSFSWCFLVLSSSLWTRLKKEPRFTHIFSRHRQNLITRSER